MQRKDIVTYTYPTLNYTTCIIGDLYFNIKLKSKTPNNGSADNLYFKMKSKSKTRNNGSADGRKRREQWKDESAKCVERARQAES